MKVDGKLGAGPPTAPIGAALIDEARRREKAG